MSQERSEGIVVRGVDFSETSRIVTFLTPNRGRMACMAAGVKRPKNQLTALLNTYNRVELVYYWRDSRSVQKLGEAALLDDYGPIKRDLDKALYGAIPLEVAASVAHENEPSEEVYACLAAGLSGLAAWSGPVQTHCCWQVLALMTAAGFAPALEVEGRPRTVGFAYASGVTDGTADKRLSWTDFDTLRRLAQRRACCPDLVVSQTVFSVVMNFTQYHLEAGLRSLRVLTDAMRNDKN